MTYKDDDSTLYVKIMGVDNCSLAKWIVNEFDNILVTVDELEGYKVSNEGWVVIEKSVGRKIIFKR